jgi:2-keto-4-pentenoate hydratase
VVVAGSTNNDEMLTRLAEMLARAETARGPISRLRDIAGAELSVADAYRIQLINIERRLRSGRRIVGQKVGLTSQAMQRMMGVDQPDFGHILDDMVLRSGDSCRTGELIAPRVEPEIAFVLARELRGPAVTPADVIAATAYVAPSIEIIDSRIAGWKIGLSDTIADNASSARVVLGGAHSAADSCDLSKVEMALEKNGKVAETGTGAATLGHPAMALAWLANKLAEFGRALEAGSLVMPGALCRAIDVVSGDVVTATFEGLGSVTVNFV